MKKLPIEPFNNVWYENCFMHAIISYLQYLRIDMQLFFKGEAILYYYFQDELCIGLEKVQNLDYYLGQCGYKIEYMVENKADKIIFYLDKSIPVLVWQDCFYLSRRMDTYNKSHLAHCVILFGYDEETNEFIVLDHEHANDLHFCERRISYEECLYSMSKYQENYKRGFCMAILKKNEQGFDMKEFEYEPRNKVVFWDSVERDIRDFNPDTFERQINLFAKYERLLRVLEYVENKDYSDEIRNAQVIKMLFGKAIYWRDAKADFQERILARYCNMHIPE